LLYAFHHGVCPAAVRPISTYIIHITHTRLRVLYNLTYLDFALGVRLLGVALGALLLGLDAFSSRCVVLLFLTT
jgi:hypothetical protein